MEMHEDVEQDVGLIKQIISEALDPVITVIKQVIEKQAAMDEELDSLAKLVQEEILGGIENLYRTKERLGGISALSSKYKDQFDPYKDFYSELTEGSDIYEKLYDELDELKKGKESWSDEDEGSEISKIAEMLKSKFEKIKGMGGQPATAIEVEISKEEEPVETDEQKLISKIRKMKQNAKDVRMN